MGLRRLRYPVPRRRRPVGRWVAGLAAVTLAVTAAVVVLRSVPLASASATSPPRPGSPAAAVPVDGATPEGEGAGAQAAAPGDRPPTAKITVGAATIAGQPVSFSSEGSADPDGGAVQFEWDFGDRTFPPPTEPAPVHVFRQPGNFTVTLKVTDASGQSATATAKVEQTQPTAAVGLVSSKIDLAPDGGAALVRVWYRDQKPDTAVVAKVCRRSIEDPKFREGYDCSLLTETFVNGTSTGAGWLDIPVFRGPEPAGDGAWGCFAPGDVAPPGIEKLTTCFIRITNNVGANTRDQREVAFTVG